MKAHKFLAALALIPAFGQVASGAISDLPWQENFPAGLPSGFTVINANNDAYTWAAAMLGGNMELNTNRHNNDDWLITPSFQLEAGKAYRFSLLATSEFFGIPSDWDDPETIEIKWGYGNTVADMQNFIIEPTDYPGNEPTVIAGWITPAESGEIFIGIHGMSSPGHYFMNVTNLLLEPGIGASRPAAVTNLTALPHPTGEHSVSISFRTPSVDISGEPLKDDLTQVELFRDGISLKTFEAPEKDVVLTYDDADMSWGYHTYSVVTATSGGLGDAAEVTVYVGAHVPSVPSDVVLDETTTPGQVKLTWAPVSIDADGNWLNPELVSYDVYRMTTDGDFVPLKSDLKELEYTFMAAETEQEIVRCVVAASTEAGKSDGIVSNVLIAGPSYSVPFAESFANQTFSHLFSQQIVVGETPSWYLMNEGSGIPSQDSDNGFMTMMGDNGDVAHLTFGKINLEGLDNPCLSFYTYNIARMMPEYPDLNELEVLVQVYGESEYRSLKRVAMHTLGEEEGWYRVMVPLDDFAGKQLRLRYTGYCNGMSYVLLDNIKIESISDKDLAVKSITFPEIVKSGHSFLASAQIENLGRDDASGYTISVLRNGEVVSTQEGPVVGFGKTVAVNMECSIGAMDEEAAAYSVEIAYEGDVDDSNNVSEPQTVDVFVSGLPYVNNLAYAVDGQDINLSWTAPDPSTAFGDLLTDNFEDQESWAKENVGKWSFYDADKMFVYGIPDVQFPGIEKGDQLSFFVVDHEGFNPLYFGAHSGTKTLGQLFVYSDIDNLVPAQCDDWAISPELYGGEQIISFWARSFNSDARETFQFLYSTTGKEISDFKLLDTFTEVQASWNRFNLEVPEGAKYFAIRVVSNYSFMLLVDDVTYIAAVDADELTLQGYNVYRDGKLVTETPITDTNYTVGVDTETHDYRVTAVYAQGESRASNAAEVSGLEDGVLSSQVSIAAERGCITVSGADGRDIRVFSVDGRLVDTRQGLSQARISLPAGVYVVAVGTTVQKAVVR